MMRRRRRSLTWTRAHESKLLPSLRLDAVGSVDSLVSGRSSNRVQSALRCRPFRYRR